MLIQITGKTITSQTIDQDGNTTEVTEMVPSEPLPQNCIKIEITDGIYNCYLPDAPNVP